MKLCTGSKVNQFDFVGPCIDKDIFILDVPVNDPCFMDLLDCVYELPEHVPGESLAHAVVLGDEVEEVFAGVEPVALIPHALHDDQETVG